MDKLEELKAKLQDYANPKGIGMVVATVIMGATIYAICPGDCFATKMAFILPVTGIACLYYFCPERFWQIVDLIQAQKEQYFGHQQPAAIPLPEPEAAPKASKERRDRSKSRDKVKEEPKSSGSGKSGSRSKRD